jgi:hypothetical protein
MKTVDPAPMKVILGCLAIQTSGMGNQAGE